jgi:cytosine/adenosine deaminase-related metal-dependent hydrolase
LCRLITIGAAEALGQDNIVGSIEVGKKIVIAIVAERSLLLGASLTPIWLGGSQPCLGTCAAYIARVLR